MNMKAKKLTDSELERMYEVALLNNMKADMRAIETELFSRNERIVPQEKRQRIVR
jgi:hypothetical protein